MSIARRPGLGSTWWSSWFNLLTRLEWYIFATRVFAQLKWSDNTFPLFRTPCLGWDWKPGRLARLILKLQWLCWRRTAIRFDLFS